MPLRPGLGRGDDGGAFPMGNGGSFYVNAGLEMVVDPFQQPTVQNQLLGELRRCDQLVQLDFRYAKIVQGASKMPWNMVWTARNQDEPVSDTDLAELRDLSWNEIIRKRYLPSLPGSMNVGETTASMLEIVREMNLQRRRFQIMGLHEQVEACEIHLVLQLCQSGILQSDRYRTMANRFRRHEKLFEAFGLAVGAFVCASAPFTMGSGMARYERDLQYEYRKNVTGLFVWALQQNMLGLNASATLDEDYVARISRLIVVWPDDGDDNNDSGGGGGRKKSRRIGLAAASSSRRADSSACCCEEVRGMVMDAVATAQGDADKARIESVRLAERTNAVDRRVDERDTRTDERLASFERRLQDEIAKIQQTLETRLAVENRSVDDMRRDIENAVKDAATQMITRESKTVNDTMTRATSDLESKLQTTMEEVKKSIDHLKTEFEEFKLKVDGEIDQHFQTVDTALKASHDHALHQDNNTSSEHTAESEASEDPQENAYTIDDRIKALEETVDSHEEALSQNQTPTADFMQLVTTNPAINALIQQAVQRAVNTEALRTQVAMVQPPQSGQAGSVPITQAGQNEIDELRRRLEILEKLVLNVEDSNTDGAMFPALNRMPQTVPIGNFQPPS